MEEEGQGESLCLVEAGGVPDQPGPVSLRRRQVLGGVVEVLQALSRVCLQHYRVTGSHLAPSIGCDLYRVQQWALELDQAEVGAVDRGHGGVVLAIAKAVAVSVSPDPIRAAVLAVVPLPSPTEPIEAVRGVVVIGSRDLPVPFPGLARGVLHPPCPCREVVIRGIPVEFVSRRVPSRPPKAHRVVRAELALEALVVTEAVLHGIEPQGDRYIAL